MNQETKQKLFDNGYLGLAKQQAWSFGSKGCAYRGENDCKCMIGFSISDHAYTERLEGYSAGSDRVTAALRSSGVRSHEDDGSFIKEMQNRCHDVPRREQAKFSLAPAIEFAKKYGLTIPEIPA